ncbi:MAG TPA: alpha-galactosidase [Chloroflexota bacterium]|nr:alpha-galactosidase [Chloroflexota bacterium]
MSTERIVPSTTAEDMVKGRSWTGQLLSAPEHLPISFLYDGHEIHGIPSRWMPESHRRRIDATMIETIFEGFDGETGLHVRVECLEYLDYPVVEWTAWLMNRGDRPTPAIADLRALDGTFTGRSPVLYHCNGDFNGEDGYTPRHTPLRHGESLTMAPNGGRACDGAFPYFRIIFEDGGLTLAVGWPGQWSASFEGLEQGVGIKAGQEKTQLRLLPGERIRTPRMTIMAWTGDEARAVNLWRRWYRDHVLPRPDGSPLRPLLTAAGTDEGEEFTAATEDNQIRYMEKFSTLGFAYDVWWIDAGWYPCYDEHHERKWRLTGTWEPDPERFPRGFRPIAEQATESGARLLVWFEPERVTRDSWLFTHHPEWLWQISGGDRFAQYALLNLGDPACRRWLTDHICTLIEDNGIKIYRQDFNFPPLRFWRENEPEDRQGINENLHVQGYLQFWDDLLARNPGLWIDSCASGGRRNDLETMRRSVPLHYTDYGYGIHPVKLAFHHTLYAWIPYFKESTLSWDLDATRYEDQIDSFSFHCGMAPMLSLALDIHRDDYDFALARKGVDLWRRASTLLLHGDYHPLTPFSRSGERWVAWQFDRPEAEEGLLQGIRHAACAEDSITIYPQALRPDADYLLENPETGETRELSGSALLDDGFTFALPRRSGAIWFYRRKQGNTRQ